MRRFKPNTVIITVFLLAFVTLRAHDLGGIWTYISVGGFCALFGFIAGTTQQVSNDQLMRFKREQRNKESVGP